MSVTEEGGRYHLSQGKLKGPGKAMLLRHLQAPNGRLDFYGLRIREGTVCLLSPAPQCSSKEPHDDC